MNNAMRSLSRLYKSLLIGGCAVMLLGIGLGLFTGIPFGFALLITLAGGAAMVASSAYKLS